MRLRVESTDQDERLLARLHGAGLHLTENRRTIVSVFFAGTQPVTTTDLWLQTKKADPRTSYGTVWRLLNALVKVWSGAPANLDGRRHPSLWTGKGEMHSRTHDLYRLWRSNRTRSKVGQLSSIEEMSIVCGLYRKSLDVPLTSRFAGIDSVVSPAQGK
jgi:hypothetical protein